MTTECRATIGAVRDDRTPGVNTRKRNSPGVRH
jgi:hypothetical protein